MKTLIVSDSKCDFVDVLESCGAETECIEFQKVLTVNLEDYDSFCILPEESGAYLEARFREKLEKEAGKGKKIFLQAIRGFQDILCGEPTDSTKSRMIYLEPSEEKIPGFCTGDLLDDEANRMCVPEIHAEEIEPVFIYQEHAIAHTHTKMSEEEILKNGKPGVWKVGKNILWAGFILRSFNEARFSPSVKWKAFIQYLAQWITGKEPDFYPASIVHYGTMENLEDSEKFEHCRKEAIEKGVRWLERFLVDEGNGGIKEGIAHNIDSDGKYTVLDGVRTDCTGESAGAFKMYAYLSGEKEYAALAGKMEKIVYGPMFIRGGRLDGMVRWCTNSWNVCYQDDVARALLPGLYDALYMGNCSHVEDICRAMDFLIRTTAKDGLRIFRTDNYDLTEMEMDRLRQEEHGLPSAHYNAYYHAALLLAGRASGKRQYTEVAQKGLERMMELYPETAREQSETEEMCRLILPLAVLYQSTGEEKHRQMLYRVAEDLQKVRHPFGGYREWDTGYRAAFSRESREECSVLTENGDPVADLLYSSNWLPMGFAFAYEATGDRWFHELWKDSVIFCLKTQMFSDRTHLDGAWCRAFDMDLKEAYAAPHDVGWAAYACETGWTVSEILMGMMMPDILKKRK